MMLKPISLSAVYALTVLGCIGSVTAASQQQTAPAASENRENTKQNSRINNEYRITAQQIGRARLGMTVKQLKQLYPKATYRTVILGEDIPSAVAVSQGSEILFYFVSSPTRTNLPADNDVINFLQTKNPRYVTAAGIRPGSLLQNAIRAYGSVKLYYSPDGEYAEFQRHPSSATSAIGFQVARPQGKNSAGVYQWNNEAAGDCQVAASGFCESTRFNQGAKIINISVAATAANNSH